MRIYVRDCASECVNKNNGIFKRARVRSTELCACELEERSEEAAGRFIFFFFRFNLYSRLDLVYYIAIFEC